MEHIVEEFNHLDMDDEQWIVKMDHLGCRIEMATVAKRKYNNSQQLLKELYEVGHKHVGFLGEDKGHHPFYVVYQGQEETMSLLIENTMWGPKFNEHESSVANEDSLPDEELSCQWWA
ncbi:hypothetical protein LINPERPRIM_LOCUS22659 [Linum perenne]